MPRSSQLFCSETDTHLTQDQCDALVFGDFQEDTIARLFGCDTCFKKFDTTVHLITTLRLAPDVSVDEAEATADEALLCANDTEFEDAGWKDMFDLRYALEL